MKNLILLSLLLFMAIPTTAQQKAARADYSYLESFAIPNAAEIQAEFARFQDSLTNALDVQYGIKQLEEDAKYANSGDEPTRIKALSARDKLSRIQNYIDEASIERGSTLYKPFSDLKDLIVNVTSRNGYDLCFLYGPNGVNDLVYKDPYMQEEVLGNIYACAKKGAANMSEAELTAHNQECQNKILNPLLENSVDITMLIKDAMGK